MLKESILSLEFDKILGAVAEFAHSEPSREEALAIRPLKSKEDIENRFGLIEDIRRLSSEGSPLGFEHFSDLRGPIEKVRPEESLLEAAELASFMPPLRTISSVRRLSGGRRDVPRLSGFAARFTGFPDVLALVEKSIDPEGSILDAASPRLRSLRTEIRSLETRIRKRLEEMTRSGGVAPLLQDVFVTQRFGRWVLPVRMDSKGQVPGLVHDVSRTGETAFIEPIEIVGLSNELENLRAEEKAEEIRILKYISKKIRARAAEMLSQFEMLVYLDAVNAVAQFSDRLSMSVPVIAGPGETSAFVLREARHPLLMLIKGNSVVPLSFALDGRASVMVITGPNAGGKTIAIKTAGLLLLMALSGMPVPADSSSSFPLLGSVLADIGDEQSIESSLSTFSAHISNISDILRKAGPDTLVLMDELGTGTDPAEGAAIACAVLNDLARKGSFVLATTHLLDIVGFVHRTEGMTNASMEFDRKTLTPLYRLKTGEPGQSHALEAAERFGMPEGALAFARGMLGKTKAELEALIADLKEKRAAYETMAAAIEDERKKLREKNALLSQRIFEVEGEKRQALRKAVEEAREIVLAAKRDVGAILEEEKKAKSAMRRLSKAQAEIEEKLREPEAPPPEKVEEGDTVFVRTLGCDADILEIDERHGRVRVRAGGITAEVPLSALSLPKGKVVSKAVKHEEKEPEAPASNINIIGMRVDEALPLLERSLNDAALGGVETVTVIHGLGTGTLRRAVREHLKGHPLVRSVRGGEVSEGGEAVTVVGLK